MLPSPGTCSATSVLIHPCGALSDSEYRIPYKIPYRHCRCFCNLFRRPCLPVNVHQLGHYYGCCNPRPLFGCADLEFRQRESDSECSEGFVPSLLCHVSVSCYVT
ncbi:hypothetical protein PF005_g2283 [Phytophthora fragariae]|uniref:Uncharacterized protein n=1 Tax=Phytophthora fragariae TaxID=53985 RepID=A0A6A4EWI7_9STRA|nr:hypothetical protein PF003_g32232 [Phytophthora fragariae]KAE8947938.1 hypothetical protein PF009_g2477 [Phytophthora fragariae]KAE9029470.1 hypothetical protein PF011_g1069 [Phytophthora fragariae]KAE9122993.1 hypothetical protein PF010_g6557 [Phytophthora fragariae]KAE9137872.1 hypothetical protein PF007_g1645 [Phytophthora fragariae]